MLTKAGRTQLPELHRSANYQDRITSILIRNIGYDPREGIEALKLNCDSLKNAMSDFYRAKPPQFGGKG